MKIILSVLGYAKQNKTKTSPLLQYFCIMCVLVLWNSIDGESYCQ